MDARRLSILAAAACLVAALVQALLFLASPPKHWLLVDLSRSSCGGREAFDAAVEQALARAVDEAREAGASLACIAYGEGARLLEPPALVLASRRAAASGGEPRGDLHAALALVDEAPGRVLILGDGAAGVAAQARLDALASAGVRSELLAPPPRVRGDAQIHDVVAPTGVPEGALPQLVVVLGAELVRGERLVVRALAADGVELARAEAPPRAPGPWRSALSLSLPPWSAPGALVRVQVLVLVPTTDAPIVHDERRLFVPCSGAATVDLAAPREHAASALALLRAGGMLVRALAPGEIPAEPAEVLVEVDPGRDEDLRRRALAAGRGVVEVPGPRSLLAGERALAALLPAPSKSGAREVHVLLDVSGSMVGEPMRAARGALSGLLDNLGAERELVLHPFAARLHAESRPRAGSAPRLPEPGGATRLLACFEEVLERRVHSGAVLLVVGDGLDEGATEGAAGGAVATGSFARAAALRQAADARGVRLAAVATGALPDRELLAALCGRVVEAGDLRGEGAAELLARALRRAGADSLIECGAAALRVEVVEPLLGAPLAAELLAGPCAWSLRAHPAANLLLEWRSETGKFGALAALRRVEAGRVLGMAGAPVADADGLAPPSALAAAVLAVRPTSGTPRVRVFRDCFSLEGLPSGVPAAVEVEVRADGARRGMLLATAPASDPSVRQGDLTDLARLALGGRSVELSVAGFVAPLVTVLEPELPAAAAVVPSREVEGNSLHRAARGARWLLLLAGACLCGAMLAPIFKIAARHGR